MTDWESRTPRPPRAWVQCRLVSVAKTAPSVDGKLWYSRGK